MGDWQPNKFTSVLQAGYLGYRGGGRGKPTPGCCSPSPGPPHRPRRPPPPAPPSPPSPPSSPHCCRGRRGRGPGGMAGRPGSPVWGQAPAEGGRRTDPTARPLLKPRDRVSGGGTSTRPRPPECGFSRFGCSGGIWTRERIPPPPSRGVTARGGGWISEAFKKLQQNCGKFAEKCENCGCHFLPCTQLGGPTPSIYN